MSDDLVKRLRATNELLQAKTKEGNPIGVTSYGLHAIEDRAPIAFVRGLDTLDLTMEPIGN
jgi:hypothetical protein